MNWKAILCLITCEIVFSFTGYSQSTSLYLTCNLQADGQLLSEVEVTVFFDSLNGFSSKSVSLGGEFSEQFAKNRKYMIVFSKDGFCTKILHVNTDFPDSEVNYELTEVYINLVPISSCGNKEPSDLSPAGYIYYDKGIDNFVGRPTLDW